MPDATPKDPTIFIASDHAGFELKSHILRTWKSGVPNLVTVPSPAGSTPWTWRDLGCFTTDRVDYPDYAQSLCRELLVSGPQSFGILICGSGQGMAMSANRFKGIRAALTWSTESTRLARAHNDANVLCLGARLIEPTDAVNFVETFLLTPFEGGRHAGRVAKIEC